MVGLHAHIRSTTIAFALLILAQLCAPNIAFAQVIPVSLAQTENNTITLTMNGNHWPLHLHQPFNAATQTPFPITGNIKDRPQDRFALTVHTWPKDVVGSLRLDNKWYQIESRNSAAQILGPLATDSDLVAMQPDVNLLGDQARGIIDEVLRHESLNPRADFSRRSTESNRINTSPQTTTRTTHRGLRVGIIVDSLFNEHHGGRGIARAVTVMNGVDAILQNDLGLAIEVVHIVDYTNPANDPFRDLASNIDSTLMPALQAERVQNSDLPENLSLVHLFTGHKDQNTNTLVGLGWLNSVCNSNGFDVSLSSPFLFDTLLAAHEIMHNLGAPHDNSDQCATYAGLSNNFLMWSKISDSSTDRLSACSIDAAAFALNADCAVDAIDMGIEMSLDRQANSTRHELTLHVINNDSTRVAPDATTLTTLPANAYIEVLPENCHLVETALRCDHEPIAPLLRTQTRVLIDISNVVDSRMRSEVILNTNIDRNRNNNVAVFNLANGEITTNDLVTVSANNSGVDLPTMSTVNLSNEPNQTVAPLSSLTQTSSSSSGFAVFGTISYGTLWAMLLLLMVRLVVTINRISRKRL